MYQMFSKDYYFIFRWPLWPIVPFTHVSLDTLRSINFQNSLRVKYLKKDELDGSVDRAVGSQACQDGLDPCDQHGGRREPCLACYPMTSPHVLWCICHTFKQTNK